MSAPAKSNGRILKNYEIIMLVVALTMILVLKLQKPATKKAKKLTLEEQEELALQILQERGL